MSLSGGIGSPFAFEGQRALINRALSRVGQSVTVRLHGGAADIAGTLNGVSDNGTLTVTDGGSKQWTVPIDNVAAITT